MANPWLSSPRLNMDEGTTLKNNEHASSFAENKHLDDYWCCMCSALKYWHLVTHHSLPSSEPAESDGQANADQKAACGQDGGIMPSGHHVAQTSLLAEPLSDTLRPGHHESLVRAHD